MKAMLAGTIALTFLVPNSAKADGKADLKTIQGTWNMSIAKRGGSAIPEGAKGKLIVEKNTFTMVIQLNGEDRKFPIQVKLDATKKPKQIDFVKDGKPNSHGIYKVEKGKLTICFDRVSGDRPKKFESPKDSRVQLLVFTRPKKEKKE